MFDSTPRNRQFGLVSFVESAKVAEKLVETLHSANAQSGMETGVLPTKTFDGFSTSMQVMFQTSWLLLLFSKQ